MTDFDLVIVGTGFTGAAFLIHFAQNINNLQKKIALVDPYITGRGPAYQKNNFNLLLNVPAFRMSLYPDKPLDFVNWLKEKGHHYHHYDFVPRSIYGDYVEECFHSHLKLFPKLSFFREWANALNPVDGQYELSLESGQMIKARQVVLSLGSPPPSGPANLKNIFNDQNYIANPFLISRITSIPKDEAVFILGKGLTALDLLQMFKDHQAPMILQSRHGRFPRPHLTLTDELIKLQSQINFNFSENPTLYEIICKFKNKIREDKIPWQVAMDVLRHQIQKLWPKLSPKDKKRFLNKLKPIWNVHRHRSPLSSLAHVENNLKKNKLELIKGEVEKIIKSDGTYKVTVKTSHGVVMREVRWIINATGPNYNINLHPSPLIQQLIKDKILFSDPMNFGVQLNDDHQLLKNLYLIGPLTLSKYVESTSVPDLRNQAKIFAQKLT